MLPTGSKITLLSIVSPFWSFAHPLFSGSFPILHLKINPRQKLRVEALHLARRREVGTPLRLGACVWMGKASRGNDAGRLGIARDLHARSYVYQLSSRKFCIVLASIITLESCRGPPKKWKKKIFVVTCLLHYQLLTDHSQ